MRIRGNPGDTYPNSRNSGLPTIPQPSLPEKLSMAHRGGLAVQIACIVRTP